MTTARQRKHERERVANDATMTQLCGRDSGYYEYVLTKPNYLCSDWRPR